MNKIVFTDSKFKRIKEPKNAYHRLQKLNPKCLNLINLNSFCE